MYTCKDVGDPSYFPMLMTNCLCYSSFRRYSPLSLEVIQKADQLLKFFGPKFLAAEMTRTFLWQIVSEVHFTTTAWLSLADFCLLISVWKAWQ